MLDNGHGFYEAEFAARRLGARFVPVSTQLRRDELSFIAADCAASAAIVRPQSMDIAREAMPAMRVLENGTDDSRMIAASMPWPGRAALRQAPMLYTSGTTGRPKGVRKASPSPEQLTATLSWASRLFGADEDMRTVIANPLYHSAAWGYSTTVLQHGGLIVLEKHFDPRRLLELVQRHSVSHLQLVPTMMHRMLQVPESERLGYDISSLRHVLHGAGPCSPATKRAMIEWWGPVLHEYYGCTETGAIVACSSQEWLERPGTVGRPRDGAVVRILDEAGEPVPAGEIGTIWMSHPATTPFRYHNATPPQSQLGLLTCGDLGRVDDDGYLYLVDRRTDLIVCGGVNVYPAEVELALQQHPEVQDCAVLGVADEEMGQLPLALVEPKPGGSHGELTLAAIREFLDDRLARSKHPRRLVLVTSLPREENGKIRRQYLGELIPDP
jgi:long-chain acyl-CoA synthetase